VFGSFCIFCNIYKKYMKIHCNFCVKNKVATRKRQLQSYSNVFGNTQDVYALASAAPASPEPSSGEAAPAVAASASVSSSSSRSLTPAASSASRPPRRSLSAGAAVSAAKKQRAHQCQQWWACNSVRYLCNAISFVIDFDFGYL